MNLKSTVWADKREKPCPKSSGEIPSGDIETNGSVKSRQQVNPILAAAGTSISKEAEELAFSEEPDEIEDDIEYRNQVKDYGGNVKSSNLDSSNSQSAVAEEPVISKETTCSTHLCSNGGLEELEPAEMTASLLSWTPSPVPQRKPLIRLNFTTLGKAADKNS